MVLGAITVLSLIPLPHGHGAGSGLNDDKVQHLIAYGSLALPVALARPRGWVWVLLGMAAWGGMIEILQPYVNREANLPDLVANGMGVVLGFLVAQSLRRLAGPQTGSAARGQ